MKRVHARVPADAAREGVGGLRRRAYAAPLRPQSPPRFLHMSDNFVDAGLTIFFFRDSASSQSTVAFMLTGIPVNIRLSVLIRATIFTPVLEQ